MDCAAYREAVSARIDGEESGLEAEVADAVDAHLAGCPACLWWAETAVAVTRSVRVGLAEPVPNLAEAIVSAIVQEAAVNQSGRTGAKWHAGLGARSATVVISRPTIRRVPGRRVPTRGRFVPASPDKVARWGLAMVAAAEACLALPALLGHDAGAPVHIAHEQGAWALALAVALALVVVRPARSAALLPFVAALSAGLAVTMVVDIAAGHTEAATEAPHGLAFLGFGMLWLLSRHIQAAASSTRPKAGTPGMAEAA